MAEALEFLLFPVSLERFFTEFYEKSALHVTGRSANLFGGLFSQRAAEALLWQHEPHIPDFVRVHKNGQDIAPPRHTGPLNYAAWASLQYQRGASIVINNLEDYELPIAKFGREIELFVGSRVSASAYLTPPSSRAFLPHFDTHDVVIMQIEGRKRYLLYAEDSTITLPLARQAHAVGAEDLGEPSDEITLQAGDVLYIPRGLVHVANTTTDLSLHISIGLHPQKIVDFVGTAVELAAESNVALRRSLLVPGRGTADSESLEQLLSSLCEILEAALSVDEVLARQRQRFVASLRPFPDRHLEREASALRLTVEDYLMRSSGAVCAVTTTPTTVRFSFPGLGVLRDENKMPIVIEAPAMVEPALRFIGTQDSPFPLSCLPGGLSDRSKLLLASRLIREGLLQVVHPRQSPGQSSPRPNLDEQAT